MSRLTHAERRRIAPPCKIENCGRPQEILRIGLCEMHLLRLKKSGSLKKPPHPCIGKGKWINPDGSRKLCVVQECKSQNIRGLAYCGKHYHRYLRYGDPTFDPIAAKRRPCKENGCATITTAAQGLCIKHARRLYAQRERGSQKRAARVAVGNAIQSGKLTKCPCEVCGTTHLVHAHHDDYSKALDVRWLCPKHHAAEH